MVDPFKPKLTRLLFEKVKAEARFEVVPAERLMLPWVLATVAEAVTVEPFRPKDTLLELLNVKAEPRLLVVPAEILMLP